METLLWVLMYWAKSRYWKDVVEAQDRLMKRLRAMVEVELVVTRHAKGGFEWMFLRSGGEYDPEFDVFRFKPLVSTDAELRADSRTCQR